MIPKKLTKTMDSIVGASCHAHARASAARPYSAQKLRSEAQRRRWTFYETIKILLSIIRQKDPARFKFFQSCEKRFSLGGRQEMFPSANMQDFPFLSFLH